VAGCSSSSLSGSNDPKSALAKALVESQLGAGLDKSSRNKAVAAEYSALEKGQAGTLVKWQGKGGKSGTVVPGQQYQIGSSTCRRFTHIIRISAITRKATRTACKDQNGIWELFE